jgi:hypothetical protein
MAGKDLKNSKNLPGQQHVRGCHQPRCRGRQCPSALAPEPHLGPEASLIYERIAAYLGSEAKVNKQKTLLSQRLKLYIYYEAMRRKAAFSRSEAMVNITRPGDEHRLLRVRGQG